MGRVAIRALLAAVGLLALALVALTVAGALYEPNTAIPAGFAGRHVMVNGVPLRVLQRGAGRDVLLIHGSPGSIEDWQTVMGALSGSFRLTAYDRPGHGFSGDVGAYSYERNAEIAQHVIEVLKLENVVVVGHSYGGTTALALALRKPKSVSGYVIVDSSVYQPPQRSNGGLYSVLASPWLGTGIARVLGPLNAERQIARGISEASGWEKPDPEFVALRTRIWSSPKVTHALAEERVGSRTELGRLSAHYPEIQQPVYILSQADDAFRRTTGEHLHRDVADSVLTLVPKSGHYVQFDQPAVVIEAIEEAVRSTDASSARR